MKNTCLNFLLLVCFALSTTNSNSQNAPVWVRDINVLPDSAYLFPVKVANDAGNNIFVLSTYMKTITPGVVENKIYLKKFDQAGGLIWTLIYDNNGIGQPRGFDMAVDNAGDCYIAGGLMQTASYKPLLLKITGSGSVAWQRDSTLNFNFSNYDQLLIKHNKLYAKATYGVATFDFNGNETWSQSMAIERIAVDSKGQVIFSAYLGNPTSIFRFDSLGVLNFSDSAIVAKRIAVDADDSFYLLTDMTSYILTKYDSSGNFMWSINSFPLAPPFGDIGFDVLIDYNNDVIVVGLSDTMFKFSPQGNLIWQKPMNGLDSYLSSAKIIFNNQLAIVGSIPDSTGYGMKVAFYDLNGNQNWWGYYNSNPVAQEFAVDMCIDNSGVYAVENNNNNTTLVKFESPFTSAIDYSLICVDSVWYDPQNPNFINVSLFNGNINHLNYPSVQIVSSTGDTIGNPLNMVSFFAHIGNSYLIYSDSISILGITNFSNYTFLVSEGFGDTTVVINWCTQTGIENPAAPTAFNLYPNPTNDFIFIENNSINSNYQTTIYNCIGMKVFDKLTSTEGLNKIDVSGFAKGLYFVRLNDKNGLRVLKFIKQ